jgi:hypothetical protein
MKKACKNTVSKSILNSILTRPALTETASWFLFAGIFKRVLNVEEMSF